MVESEMLTSSRSKRVLAVVSYLLPVVLGLFVVTSVILRERVLGMSWEFSEYGSIARNIVRGDGAVSGSFEPYDLSILRNVAPKPRPPIVIFNRTLLPIWLTVAAVWTFGANDGAIMLPHILALIALLLLATHIERRLAPGAILPVGAVLLAFSPVVYQSAIQCYPNVLFAALFVSFLCLVWWVSKMSYISVPYLSLLGLLAGLCQLTRTDFVLCLAPVTVYLIAIRGSRGAAKPIVAMMFGWVLLNSLEWWYALSHYGIASYAARSDAIWTNLANVKYGSTWLYYVQIDRKDVLFGYWRQHLTNIAQNAPRGARLAL